MSVLVDIDEYDEPVIKLCPNGTQGEVVSIGELLVSLPAQPPEEEIEGYGRTDDLQLWERIPMPKELSRIRSMDEWGEMPREFQTEVFVRISKRSFAVGVRAFGFINNGEPYIYYGAVTT